MVWSEMPLNVLQYGCLDGLYVYVAALVVNVILARARAVVCTITL